ncbi:hypothetical protein COF09_05530 [Bacillus toyonensis]|uniref:hypothetical protein n=1 Tax=Bacillus toyonensis TaxID=155322 RepID=UPI000BFBF0B2|nr:hypothetical protein [Bacillus toyonensis]PHC44627.1 hypothetical protein COF09_05530 [Bacillus toyonensis]
MDKQKRIEIVNSLIKYLADHEREFFRYKDRTARFEHDGRNLWFIDHGTNVPMRMTRSSYMNKKQEHNFSGGLHCTHWGWSEEGMEKMREYAREIGYLKAS